MYPSGEGTQRWGHPILPSEKTPPRALKAAELCWVIRHQLQQAPGTPSHLSRRHSPASAPPLKLWWGRECSMKLLCQLSFFLYEIHPAFILSFLSAAAIRHVNFAVMQGLLFPLHLGATAATGCPSQRVPTSQGSCRQEPTSPFAPSGHAARLPSGKLRSAVRKREQK